ncbi:hypothetical protein F2Q68_00007502 [Brassica cretica]|uniref:Neprosin PEP catalytic domain-containing protein n=1 Tax=Brassica cretica TaxID=69181 RepID=A0A8S9KMN0_BRACR|nr:hypothetical protein F2Q68_00007502 [Brassica cretica]
MEVIVLASNRSLLLIFLVFVSLLSIKVTHVSAVNYTKTHRQVSSLRVERIRNHLNNINKPPVFTIQSPDGDVIDCVPKRKQPALDHPLLKHHKIQKAPRTMPKMVGKERSDDVKEAASVLEGAWQMWHVNGTKCPKGTVPIRRNTMDDVLRAKSLFDFGKKRRSIHLDQRTEKPDALGTSGHEHAIAYTETSSEIYGAKATINVWDPKIEQVNEFSLSQIWILSGSFVGPDLNSIEAGWQVSPELYGDNRPRLFTYWTKAPRTMPKMVGKERSDDVKEAASVLEGAWQMWHVNGTRCPKGTVPIRRNTLDDVLRAKSLFDFGKKRRSIHLDQRKEKPDALGTSGHEHAIAYTETSSEIYGAKATINVWDPKIEQVNEFSLSQIWILSGSFVGPDLNSIEAGWQDVTILAENTECYDIKSSSSNEWGTYFYYGGPGFNPRCA